MTNLAPEPRQSYKALLFDYDYLIEKSDDECCYSLSEREIQIIMAQIDYIGWKTRYKPTSTEIDQDLIDKWMSNLARKLMSGCCPDDEAIHRYLADGTFQTSLDGGETWEDDPTGDPRHGAILSPEIPGSPSLNLRCAAADNVRDQYEVMRDNTIALLTAGTTVLAIVAGLVGLIGGILAISVVGVSFGVILFGMAAALLSLTPESVAEQIDDEALETFRCIVYCHLDNTGRVAVGGLDDILSDIASQFSDFPESFFYSITASMGATGINNAATMGVATADDCDECECGNACELATQPWEIGNVLSTETDPDTGITTVVVESEFLSGTNSVRWGIFADSEPNGCKCTAFGPSTGFCDDWYYRIEGEPDSSIHGPVSNATFSAAIATECVNLLQVNCGVAFTLTATFEGC